MTEPQTETMTETPAPAKPKRKAKPRKRAAKPSTKDIPIAGGEFAGVSATQCCAGCSPARCLISTVDICKHPFKTSDSGCGPVTRQNREKVRKLIKHQLVDLKG